MMAYYLVEAAAKEDGRAQEQEYLRHQPCQGRAGDAVAGDQDGSRADEQQLGDHVLGDMKAHAVQRDDQRLVGASQQPHHFHEDKHEDELCGGNESR